MTSVDLHCSFCFEGQDKVDILFQGPAANICDGCLQSAWEDLAEQRAATGLSGKTDRSALAQTAEIYRGRLPFDDWRRYPRGSEDYWRAVGEMEDYYRRFPGPLKQPDAPAPISSPKGTS